ncbi:hypothetical protein ABTE16_19615, partial [Acinetobacter baumannii]
GDLADVDGGGHTPSTFIAAWKRDMNSGIFLASSAIARLRFASSSDRYFSMRKEMGVMSTVAAPYF